MWLDFNQIRSLLARWKCSSSAMLLAPGGNNETSGFIMPHWDSPGCGLGGVWRNFDAVSRGSGVVIYHLVTVRAGLDVMRHGLGFVSLRLDAVSVNLAVVGIDLDTVRPDLDVASHR